MLVVSCCNGAELLEFVEEALHEVAQPVDPTRENERAFAIGLRRNVRPGLPLGGFGPNGVGVIALVGQQDVPFAERFHQGISFGAVSDLAPGQAQIDRTSIGVDERVDLARKPATGTSHATIVSIPFFPVAAC